jgi:hypothetical protein
MLLESELKDQLYTALAKAQAEFPVIQPNRKAYKNEYADLYAIFKPIYPVLEKHGLAIKPWAGQINGEQWIGARLSHKSGQFETNIYKFESDPVKNPNDQYTHKKQGALTYFNRNHMKDMLGILITEDLDDDDGQPSAVHHKIDVVSQDQLIELNRVLDGHKDICEQVMKGWGINSLAQMPKDKYSVTIDRIGELKYKKSQLNIK